MRPTRRLTLALVLWAVPGLVLPWWEQAALLWAGLGAALALALLLDLLSLRGLSAETRRPTITRTLPAALALGVWQSIELRVNNPGKRALQLQLFDGVPDGLEHADLPLRVRVPGAGFAELGYRLRALRRGTLEFGATEVLIDGPLRLLRRRLVLGEPTKLRVYPNFRAVAEYALLTLENREHTLGIHRRRRRGQGMEFFQLRGWRDGDTPRQVDWKATSRRATLISRDYHEEQNQQVMFLLDCGRRMRAEDGDLSHFDQALNATLLLSYVALRSGDAVGFSTFGGQDRWLPPQRGPAAMPVLLERLFDLETSLSPPDFTAAVERVMAQQRRRALIVLVSNLRDEDGDEIFEAVTVLRRRHVVLVASLREQIVRQMSEAPVHDLQDALRAAGAIHYDQARRRAHDRLRQRGVHVLDVEPADLPVALVNRYLDIKRAGTL